MIAKIHIIQHGVVVSTPQLPFGCYGWPSITRGSDDTLYVVASGGRHAHVCPWGRTVIAKSTDNGATWSAPVCINNTPLDDRDAGIIALPNNRLAVTWFASNIKVHQSIVQSLMSPEYFQRAMAVMNSWDEELLNKYTASWIRVSEDGESWGEMRQAPVNSPHGFIVLKDGSWLYFGKKWQKVIKEEDLDSSLSAPIVAARSTDEGRSWKILGEVPLLAGMDNKHLHEAHVLELNDGTLLGAIRDESPDQERPLKILLTESRDGGTTWSPVRRTDMSGAPPHLLKHSSGKIICSYGYRQQPYGQRVAISSDNGKTWDVDLILRDDGPTEDLGYPATVELPGGDLFTIYYQQFYRGEKHSIQYTRWSLDQSF